MKKISQICIFSIFVLAPFLLASDKPIRQIQITENHWQVALNNKLFKGKMESIVSSGRADIENDISVVEIDRVSNYKEGIEQAQRYAKVTGKKPVLALYIDGDKDGLELLRQADKLCYEKNVRLILVNCYVSVNDLFALVSAINPDKPVPSISPAKIEAKYWLTSSSGIRHNSSCRYYMNSKGRTCTKDEGRACKICGG
jgi:hypothetical protein